MLKKDKMVSCREPGRTNRADKNSNIITLVATIMLLQLYCGIFRTLVYLMPEAYSKPCKVSKMMKHTENPGIVRTAYSDIFRHIQAHSGTFSNIQPCSGILRDFKAYLDIFRHY